jgi:quinone-modifying oxidoreductase subunit QmoC
MTYKHMIKYEAECDPKFAEWVTEIVGGEKIRQCIQCGICSATCPLSLYMDYPPRKLVHLAKEGFKNEVLKSNTIWLCASCYSCTVECSKQIKVTDIMYALKRRAIEEGIFAKGVPIPVLAKEFYKMVRSEGRTTESWLVVIMLLKTNILKIFGMTTLGLNLLRTGRFSFLKDSIKRKDELKSLLDSLEGASS